MSEKIGFDFVKVKADILEVMRRDRQRADEWKAMAKRLYKAAICDCCEHNGTACHRCLSTIQAYTNLAAKEKGAG